MKVSQKVIVRNREGKILALRRSGTDPSRPLSWDLPGGQIEEGEDLMESLKREAKEEAGIQLPEPEIFDAVAGLNKNGHYWVQIGYLVEMDSPKVTLSYEHDQYEWITTDEFLSRESSLKIKRFLNKLKGKAS